METFYNGYGEGAWRGREHMLSDDCYDGTPGYSTQDVGYTSSAYGAFSENAYLNNFTSHGNDMALTGIHTDATLPQQSQSSAQSSYSQTSLGYGDFRYPLTPCSSGAYSPITYAHQSEQSAVQFGQGPSSPIEWMQLSPSATTSFFSTPTTPTISSTTTTTTPPSTISNTSTPAYTSTYMPTTSNTYIPLSPSSNPHTPHPSIPNTSSPTTPTTTTSTTTSTPSTTTPTPTPQPQLRRKSKAQTQEQSQTQSKTQVTCACGEVLHGPHAIGNLTRHRRSLRCTASSNEKKRVLKCESCATPFRRSDALLNHRRKKHGAPPGQPRA